jgi:hypothetical protein
VDFDMKELAPLEKEVKLDRQELLEEYRTTEWTCLRHESEYLVANRFPNSRSLADFISDIPLCLDTEDSNAES